MAAATADVPLRSGEAAAQVEPAPAKINLALHVVGRRPDGLHLIDSLAVFAGVSDTVTATTTARDSAIALRLDGPFAPCLAALGARANLAWKAAAALADAAGTIAPGGVDIALTKRLPVAAGLGGGSADAAAVLRLLNRVWRLALDAGTLARIGAGLGADVPVCLASRPSRMGGAGEALTPVAGLPPLPVVLVSPDVAVSTREVFEGLAEKDNPPLPAVPERFASVDDLVTWLEATRNDLFRPARAVNPAVATAAEALASDPDCRFSRMSGSGATSFGIFASRAAAERAAARLRAAEPAWWIAATETGGS